MSDSDRHRPISSCGIRRVPTRRSFLPLLFRGVFLLPFLLTVASAQPDETDPLPSDSTTIDSTAVPDADSVAAPVDSSHLFLRTVPPPGAVQSERDFFGQGLTKYDIPDRLRFTLFDPLLSNAEGFVMSGSVPGELGGISYAGGDPAAVSFLFNGRILRGADAVAYDPSLYPLEFLEKAEYVDGGRAIVYGGADALRVVNILQPQFDVEGSYLRLVFGKGGGGTARAEGIFARNLSRRTNLSVGFRRLTSDGLYGNQSINGMNIYGSLYHRYDGGLTASLTGMVTDFERGANGGLAEGSLFGSSAAAVRNDTLTEGRLRHDLTLTFRWIPELRGVTAVDSINTSGMTRYDGNVYFSHGERSLLIGDREAVVDGFSSHIQGDLFGFNGSVVTRLGTSELRGAVRGEIENGEDGNLHAGGLLLHPLAEGFLLGGGGAITNGFGRTGTTLFAEFRGRPGDSTGLRGTWRYGIGDGPVAVNDTLLTLSGEGTLWLGELEGIWNNGGTNIRIGGWIRRGVRTTTSGAEEYTIAGGRFSGHLPLAFMRVGWHIDGTVTPEGDERYPSLAARSEISVPRHLLNGALDLDLGTNIAWQSSFSGIEHDPITGLWLYPRAENTGERQSWGLIDLFASARIGTAYLNLTFFNLLDAEYRTVSRYPTWGRSIRFGITWSMID